LIEVTFSPSCRKATANPLERTSPADEIDENHDDGDDQENVDEPTHRIGGNEPQGPQDKQNERNGVQHGVSFRHPISGWLAYVLSDNLPDGSSAGIDATFTLKGTSAAPQK
jgi:hypothetical protein